MSQSNLIKPQDRVAASAEREFKISNQKPLSNTVTVVVYTNYETEMVPQPSISGLIIVRAYEEDEHHLHMIDPKTVPSNQRRKEVLKSYLAHIEGDNPNVSQLVNGSKWNAIKTSDTMFSLISPISNSYTSLSLDAPETTEQQKTSSNFQDKKEKLSEYPKQNSDLVKITYKTEYVSKEASSGHYSKFLKELAKRLSESNFSSSFVQVNSLTRTPKTQAAAMVDGRFGGNSGKPLSFFRDWALTTYGTNSEAGKEINKLANEKEWTNPSDLKAALTVLIQKQVARGLYISAHLKSGALDLNSNKLSFDDVKILLDVLSSMKNDKFVTKYKWEGVSDKKGGEDKRKSGGVYDSNEHIHLSINVTVLKGE